MTLWLPALTRGCSEVTTMRIRRARFTACNSGQTLVEFSLALPLLLMVLTGIFAIAISLNNYLELTHAVNNGGKLLSVSRGQPGDLCQTATQAIANAAPLLNSAQISYTIVLTPQGGTGSSYGSSCSSATLSTGETATVTATYPCTLAIYSFIAPSCTLKARATEFVQ
jgi:Flp pilus assembly protein TadG